MGGTSCRVGEGDHGRGSSFVSSLNLIVTGTELDAMTDADLDRVLTEHREIIFARNSPEAKLRIADALHTRWVK